jgi:hypothetical protein
MIGPEIISIVLLSDNFISLLRLKYESTFDTHFIRALSVLFFCTSLHPTFCKRCLICTVPKLPEIIYRSYLWPISFMKFISVWECSRVFAILNIHNLLITYNCMMAVVDFGFVSCSYVNESPELFTTMSLRTQFFWDMILPQWLIRSRRFERT